jgi:hypothetical protein
MDKLVRPVHGRLVLHPSSDVPLFGRSSRISAVFPALRDYGNECDRDLHALGTAGNFFERAKAARLDLPALLPGPRVAAERFFALGDFLYAFDVPGGVHYVSEAMVSAGLNDNHDSTPHP